MQKQIEESKKLIAGWEEEQKGITDKGELK